MRGIGPLALENGDDIEAERLTDAADIRGEGALIAYVRGNIAARRGRLDDAIARYDEALTLDPTHVRARLNRCSAYLGGDLPSARSRTPNASWCRRQILACTPATCRIKMALTHWNEAVDDLKVIIDAVPNHHHALTQMAACQVALDRPERAEAPLNEALRAAPTTRMPGTSADSSTSVGSALRKRPPISKRPSAAGRPSRSPLHLAAIHHTLGNHEEAAAAWRAVLSIDPDHALARRRLEQSEQHLVA